MSSLKDLASLIMIPSLVKDGRLDTVKPLGNSIIHPDATGNNDGTDGSTPAEGNFTFSRGSNLAATRVDVNGLIEKGRENLILQSNNFSSASWSAAPYVTSTGGQEGYDGTNDAWELEVAISGNYCSLTQASNTSGLITNSIYAKAGNSNFLGITDSGGTGGSNCIFDLTNGSISYQNGGNFIETSSESIGNGWYRLKVTHIGTSPNYALWFVANAGNSTGGTAGDSVFIQDAQQENSLVATDYIETGASTAQAGILEDLPRLDYSGGASCPSLLLEPQRTNKITNSEYINTTTFNQNNLISISNNYATSPEGLQNAAKIIPTAVSGYHQIRTDLATPNGYDIISCFVKASGYNYVQLASWADPENYVNFDLTDGSIGSVGANGPSIKDIEDYGNGWYRIHANVQASGGGLIGIGIVTSASAGWAQSFTGNGTDGLLIWGAQLEAGSYPTSYIPTYGSAVTRSVDDCSATGISSVIGQTQGVIFMDFIWSNSSPTGGDYALMVYGADTADFVSLNANGNTNQMLVYAGGSAVAAIGGGNFVIGQRYKIALVYRENYFAYYINGVLKGTDTSGAVPNNLQSVRTRTPFGLKTSSQKTQQLVFFPTALTDSECIALTTL